MKQLGQQIFRFVIVGSIATLIDFITLYICYHLLGINYLIGTSLAFIVSTLFNYWASIRFIFVSKYQAHEKREELSTFLILSILGLGLTNLLIYVAVDSLNLPVMFSKVLVTAVVMCFNFLSRKFFLEDRSASKKDPKQLQSEDLSVAKEINLPND